MLPNLTPSHRSVRFLQPRRPLRNTASDARTTGKHPGLGQTKDVMTRRILAYATLAAVSVALLPAHASALGRPEQPRFVAVGQVGDMQIRRYAPRLEAVVRVRAKNARDASNQGFRVLAGFIFGNNEAREKVEMTSPVGRSQEIAMTAPVGRERQGDVWTISFTMPSQWKRDTLPRPLDSRVTIREIPETLYAVLKFRGSPSEGTLAERENGLRVVARGAGYTPVERASIYNRYDPPWIPPLLRRNELWIALEARP